MAKPTTNAQQASLARAPFHGSIKTPRDGWTVLIFNVLVFLACVYFIYHQQYRAVLPEHHVAGGTIKDKSEAEEQQEAQEMVPGGDEDEEDDEEDANPLENVVGMQDVPPVDDEAWVKDEL